MDQISIKGKHKYRMTGLKYNVGIRFFLFFAFALLFYFSFYHHIVPQTYDMKLGSKSEKKIIAPRQIENIAATQRAKDEAEQKVQPVYTYVPLKNTELTGSIFDKLEELNQDDQITLEQKAIVYRSEFNAIFSTYIDHYIKTNGGNPAHNEMLLAEMKNRIADQQYRIPEEAFFKFPRLTSEELAEMEPVAKTIVTKLMADQFTNAQTPRAQVAEMVNASQLTKKKTRELVQEIVRFVITPNKFLDQEATYEARSEARENTRPVYIEKNQVIVKAGDVITKDIYEQLRLFNLLNDKVNYWPQLGLLIMVGLFVVVLYMFIKQSNLAIQYNNTHLLMLFLIFLLNMTGMKIVALGQNLEYPFIGYLAPIAMGAMLITLLLDGSIAFISSILFGISASIIYNAEQSEMFDFRFGFVAVVVGFVAIFAIHRASQRSAILKAGIMVSFLSCIAVISIILIDNQLNARDIVLSLSFAFAGGLLTAVLVIGVLPFFEISFGILSPLKLVELSNPNHPLLRKLLTETPGTYHHSVMVGNLSEAAAESIGANGLLCRVGSFYHDIGKTKRPSYFIENQVNMENPHDPIDPKLSKSIIIAHARDGVEMLKEYKIPKQICDIAEQHHGTTLLKFFYHKAIKQSEQEGKDPSEVTEEQFRYPGPKAQSKEAAIVGIADCVEAAVRSLRNPTIEQIDLMVRKIIKSRLDDNQFNECDLTLKELDMIAKTLKEALLGIFHSRIEYPEDLSEKKAAKGD